MATYGELVDVTTEPLRARGFAVVRSFEEGLGFRHEFASEPLLVRFTNDRGFLLVTVKLPSKGDWVSLGSILDRVRDMEPRATWETGAGAVEVITKHGDRLVQLLGDPEFLAGLGPPSWD